MLIDGRIVFSPVLGGVYGDVQDMLLEDSERIEVIRCPEAFKRSPQASRKANVEFAAINSPHQGADFDLTHVPSDDGPIYDEPTVRARTE